MGKIQLGLDTGAWLTGYNFRLLGGDGGWEPVVHPQKKGPRCRVDQGNETNEW